MTLATNGEWREYRLLPEDIRRLSAAAIGLVFNESQEASNRIWEELGKRMGFQWMSVKRHSYKGSRFFLAKPLDSTNPTGEVPS